MARDQFLVIGAGVAGLAAARALQDADRQGTVLEACSSVGGLTRSIHVDRYCFDYGGHLLHLSRYASPSDIPYAGLHNEDWTCIDRNSLCYVGGKMVRAPIQYHLGDLPEPLRSECIESYRSRPHHQSGTERSFMDYLISGFGESLARTFLIRQNEKTLASSLDRMSSGMAKRFFPPPDEEKILSGINGVSDHRTGYNSEYWYPRIGGIEILPQGLSSGLEPVHLLQEAVNIDLATHELRTRRGDVYEWDVMLSSMPLVQLCLITGNARLRELASLLSAVSTVIFNVGVRGTLAPALSDAHWVYVPGPDIPFYRFGVYSNFSQGMCGFGDAALYIEVGVPPEKLDGTCLLRLGERVLNSLDSIGWVSRDQVTCCVASRIRCGYVHHFIGMESTRSEILSILRQADVHPIGRYGRWDYMSMEDVIHDATCVVGGLT